jgi:hypothetical protein
MTNSLFKIAMCSASVTRVRLGDEAELLGWADLLDDGGATELARAARSVSGLAEAINAAVADMPADRDLHLQLKDSGRWNLNCPGPAVYRREGDHVDLSFLLARWNSSNPALEWLLRATGFLWSVSFDLSPPRESRALLPAFGRAGQFTLSDERHLRGTARTVRWCCRIAGIDPDSIDDAQKGLYCVDGVYAARRPQVGAVP